MRPIDHRYGGSGPILKGRLGPWHARVSTWCGCADDAAPLRTVLIHEVRKGVGKRLRIRKSLPADQRADTRFLCRLRSIQEKAYVIFEVLAGSGARLSAVPPRTAPSGSYDRHERAPDAPLRQGRSWSSERSKPGIRLRFVVIPDTPSGIRIRTVCLQRAPNIVSRFSGFSVSGSPSLGSWTMCRSGTAILIGSGARGRHGKPRSANRSAFRRDNVRQAVGRLTPVCRRR